MYAEYLAGTFEVATAGDGIEALALMREAADLEDGSKKHIAMENRLIPMRELLADIADYVVAREV